jgi:GT2 family glycosyltransferase
MIFIEFENDRVTSDLFKGKSVITAIQHTALNNPDSGIIIFKKGTDSHTFLERIKELATPYSFISSSNTGLQDIGYVEDGPFIKVSIEKPYPTWIKSDTQVYLHARFVNQIGDQISTNCSFLYWLNSIGKLSRPQGIFNYQVPLEASSTDFSDLLLYRFAKQHYKSRWVLFLLLCHIWYERRFPLFAFAKAWFTKPQKLTLDLESLQKKELPVRTESFYYDVIIPTLGRATYLKDVLNDLAAQTMVPKNVIIVEQNEDFNAQTELDYIKTHSWPFIISHEFTHKTGACNARNKAIAKTTAPWVLFFDDDNRFDNRLMERVLEALEQTGACVLSMAYLQVHEVETQMAFKQWESFGSGCSIVHREVIEKCKFDIALEHGYGEDVDYGMQIRNAGYDVIYAPKIQILHLKAPTGGFRKLHMFPWVHDVVQPKPSPQIMYHRKKNYSTHQLKGYKMVLFFKTFGNLGGRTPWGHFRAFKYAWNQSERWANTL